jgi:putative ABC transport system permease protein
MRLRDRLRVLTQSWFRSGRLDQDLDEELRFHLEEEIRAQMARGLSRDDARLAAHRSFGNLDEIKEISREARSGAAVRQLIRDMGYGCRLLRKAPAFASAAILIVAVGIGAATAIFSVVHGVLLRPLPYENPESLISVWTRVPRLGQPRVLVNAADHREWRASSRVLEDIALVRPIANFNLVGDGEPERLLGARVSANLFSVLGVEPALGRVFTEEEDEIGREDVVLLSHALWKRRFGGDPGMIGRTIRLSGKPHVVVGVMRPDFQYPRSEFQVWTPLTVDPRELTREIPGYNFLAVARLKPGKTRQDAQSEMDVVAARLATAHPESNRDVGVEVVGMLDDAVQPVRGALFLLLGAVLCLVLIACLNLTNLLGARARSRGREFAVRLALGASRRRLVLQALAEVVPVLVTGGLLGMGLAAVAVAAFIPLAPATLPRAASIELSAPVLAFSASLLALTGLVAGLLPAAQGFRADLSQATRSTSRGATGDRRHARSGQILVVTQIALAVPLLVGAVLLARSFATLTRIDPGFRAENVLSLHLAIPRSKYPGDPEVAAMCTRLLGRVAALPGVASAGMVNRLPLGGVGQIGMIEVENPGAVSAPQYHVDWRTATPSYFTTLGIPLREGRLLTEQDREQAPPVALVDEQLARAQWPGQSALGKRFRLPVDGAPWIEIVGVVGHVRHDGLDVDRRPQVYWNHLQRAQDRMVLVVRAATDLRSLTPAVLQAIRSVDPEQPVYDVRTMDEVVERSLGERWLSTALLGAFAGISLLLSSVGVYGVVAYGVTTRVREFGIRLALGAERGAVTRLVLGQGAALATLGTLAGLAAALVLGGVMDSLLFGVAARDAASLGLSAALLLGVALLASYLPARRAAAIDPALTLRSE